MERIDVVEQGCTIKRKDIRFVIYKEGVINETVPYFEVNNIILWGRQNITGPALDLAFEKGIDVLFFSLSGKLKGKIQGAKSKNVYIRLAQYELWRDKEKKLQFSKAIIKNKINNQYKLLKYYGIDETEIIEIKEKVNSANEIDQIMGFEGIASKIYFSHFKSIITNDFEFEGRNRRPPKDEVNALLSLTYSMVLNNILTELEASGLDSYLGFLHAIKYGRQALALDILEEFRQGFCDTFVIKLINRKEVKKEDFVYSEEEGMRFTPEAFKKYLEKYNNEKEGLTKIIKEQIEKLKISILNEEEYKGYEFSKRR